MSNLFCSPLFYIFLTLFTYTIFSFIYHKCKFPLFNPLLLTSIVIILYLLITKYSVNSYTDSLSIVNIFLSPLTVCLAIPVFNRIQIVKHYFLPIVVGTIIGAIVSIGSVLLFGKMLHLDQEIIMSMIPKSVTTPIALEISEKLGGIKGITVSASYAPQGIKQTYITFGLIVVFLIILLLILFREQIFKRKKKTDK